MYEVQSKKYNVKNISSKIYNVLILHLRHEISTFYARYFTLIQSISALYIRHCTLIQKI